MTTSSWLVVGLAIVKSNEQDRQQARLLPQGLTYCITCMSTIGAMGETEILCYCKSTVTSFDQPGTTCPQLSTLLDFIASVMKRTSCTTLWQAFHNAQWVLTVKMNAFYQSLLHALLVLQYYNSVTTMHYSLPHHSLFLTIYQAFPHILLFSYRTYADDLRTFNGREA